MLDEIRIHSACHEPLVDVSDMYHSMEISKRYTQEV